MSGVCQRRSYACSQRLATARLLVIGVHVLRLEAVALHADLQCLSAVGVAMLFLGLLLGLGSHIASVALLSREHEQMRHPAPPLNTCRGRATVAATAEGWQHSAGPESPPWLQSLVVPLSLAGLVLELLSGAPTIALPHGRTVAVMLMLSIALQRDPLSETLPQLAAALALDFVAFLAATLTHRYNTLYVVVQHLLSTIVVAVLVVAITPLYNKLAATMAVVQPSPLAQDAQQQQQAGTAEASSLVAELGDDTVLARPLVGLPPAVVQLAERQLSRSFRRALSAERFASALLILVSLLRGPEPRATHVSSPGAALTTTATSAASSTTGAAFQSILRARAAAASLVLVTSSTLLVLNGLLALLSGRLFEEHSVVINAVVTAAHALGHVIHVLLFAPWQRSRSLLVRMMIALTVNVVGNRDPWVAFLTQLLVLLGLVTTLDTWLGGRPVVGIAGGCNSGGGGGTGRGEVVAGPAGDVSSALPFRWLLHHGQRFAVAASPGLRCVNPAGGTVAGSVAAHHLLPLLCYSLIAAAGAALRHRLSSKDKYLRYYRLYRRFYLPAAYGGACVSVPVPYDEVLQLRDSVSPSVQSAGAVQRSGGVPPFSSGDSCSSASTAIPCAPCHQPSSRTVSMRSLASRGSSQNRITRRSVSLNAFVGVGELGDRKGTAAAYTTAGSSQGDSLLAVSSQGASGSHIASAATVSAASAVKGASRAGDVSPLSTSLFKMSSPFPDSSMYDSWTAACSNGGGGGGGGGAVAVLATAGGDVPRKSHELTRVAVAPNVATATRRTGPQGEGSGGDGHVPSAIGPEGCRSVVPSALELDEADVISGKFHVTRKLNQLAAMDSGGEVPHDADSLHQLMEVDISIGLASSMSDSEVVNSGMAAACAPHYIPISTNHMPPRRSSDISCLHGSSKRPFLIVGLATQAGGGLSGASGGTGGAGGGASFLESVAASLASEEFAAACRASGGGNGGGASNGVGTLDVSRTGGQSRQVHRLRVAPLRSSSDVHIGRHSLQIPQSPLAYNHAVAPVPAHPHQHHQYHPVLSLHRLPRRSPSDVSYLSPGYQRADHSVVKYPWPGTAASSSRYGQGASALFAVASGGYEYGNGSWMPPMNSTPAVGGGAAAGGGTGPAGARGPLPDRRGPSRGASHQHTGVLDSTALMLLDQDLIRMGSSSGGLHARVYSSGYPNVDLQGLLTSDNNALTLKRGVRVPSGDGALYSGLESAIETLPGAGDADRFAVRDSLELGHGLWLSPSQVSSRGGKSDATAAVAVAVGPSPALNDVDQLGGAQMVVTSMRHPAADADADAAAAAQLGRGRGGAAAAVVAEVGFIRSKVGVSWSGKGAGSSGGSTGSHILTAGSKARKTSKVDRERAAATTAHDTAAGAHGSGHLGDMPAATVTSPKSPSGARPPASYGPSVSPPHQSHPPPDNSLLHSQLLPVHLPHVVQYDMASPFKPRLWKGGGPVAKALTVEALSLDTLRGSGEASDNSNVINMEQARAALELLDMWTTSSIGESQLEASTQSSVSTVLPLPPLPPSPQQSAIALMAAPEVKRAAPTKAEAQDALKPSALSSKPLQRRLSQVLDPWRLLGTSRPQARGHVAEQHTASSAQMQPRACVHNGGCNGGCDSLDVSVPCEVPLGSSVVGESLALRAYSGQGGSCSSQAFSASTVMSFDNWATAIELEAMLLDLVETREDGSAPTPLHPAHSQAALAGWSSSMSQGRAPSLPPHSSVSTYQANVHSHPSPPQCSSSAGVKTGIAAPVVPRCTPSLLRPGLNTVSRNSGVGAGGRAASRVSGRAGLSHFVVPNYLEDASYRRPIRPAVGPGSATSCGKPAAVLMNVSTQQQLPPTNARDSQQHPSHFLLMSKSHSQLKWEDADQVMPLRSPSAPNMQQPAVGGMHARCVRHTSSMGKSRLGSMSSASSCTQDVLTTSAQARFSSYSPPSVNSPSASTDIIHPPHLQPQSRPATSPHAREEQAAGTGSIRAGSYRCSTSQLPGVSRRLEEYDLPPDNHIQFSRSVSPLEWTEVAIDDLDSYAHLPLMRASQVQLALSLPSSSLRDSGDGRQVGRAVAAAVGDVGAIVAVGARDAGGLATAVVDTAVSRPVLYGWPLDAAQQQRRQRRLFSRLSTRRRSSLDERLFKQVIAARLLDMPAYLAAPLPSKGRGRRRSVGSLASPEYIPSRLSQDGKAVRAATAAAGKAGPESGAGAVSPGSLAPGPGPPPAPTSAADSDVVARQRIMGVIPELHIPALFGPGGGAEELAVAVGPSGAPRLPPPPSGLVAEDPLLSVAGSIATAVTGSTTSLQSFADVALGGVNYF